MSAGTIAAAAALEDAPVLANGPVVFGDFEIPDSAVAHEPPEARGLQRDAVRLMVSRIGADAAARGGQIAGDTEVAHTRFADLPRFLVPGDLIVVNASATIPAALRATRPPRGAGREGPEREAVLLHLSAPVDSAPVDSAAIDSARASERRPVTWVVELRRRTAEGHRPLLDAEPGELIELPERGVARLLGPYRAGAAPAVVSGPDRSPGGRRSRIRLWVAELTLPDSPLEYLARHGAPIRYSYVPIQWPLSYYQTAFSDEPGSAEMPSAGRPFTRTVLEDLGRSGVSIARIVLHTGVSSPDAGEPPYPERFRVSPDAAVAVNRARTAGGRVIAVGTTVVRALESAASPDGWVHPAQGWTDLVITAERGLRVVDGLVTGLHAPEASHLAMLEAFADGAHLRTAYREALRLGYRWHEFGDSHLLLP